MPGMSLVCELTGRLEDSEPAILRSLDSLLHTERFERKTLMHGDACFLGYTKYEGYPVRVVETEEFYFCLEGHLYGKSDAEIEAAITELAERVFRPGGKANGTVADWLLATDGDFLLFMMQKPSREIAIVNDVLGRLSLFYCQANGRLLVTREVGFITNLVPRKTFDRMAIAQYLLCGHPLGQRTLLENVRRLPPASLMRINVKRQKVEIQSFHRWNVEEKKHLRVSVTENASNLVSLFTDACRSRTDLISRNVVSLSGGLDSRSVAACLSENRIPFSAATFLDSEGTADGDARIAARLARALKADWRLFYLRPPKGRDLLRLLRTKGGLNPLDMSFILPFFDAIIEAYGPRVTYFTGHGGDTLIPSMLPLSELRSLDDFVNWIVTRRRGRIFTLDSVSALTGVPSGDIVDEIGERLASYPETDWNVKCVHHRIFEVGLRWSYEGEDRNRYFFWSASPFYSVRFFEYVINCPEEQKARYVLYHAFLSRLSRRASAIPDVMGKLATGRTAGLPGYAVASGLLRSGRLGILGKLIQSRRRARATRLVERPPMADASAALLDCLAAQIETCGYVRDYLSHAAVLTILRDRTKRYKRDLGNLFTIASVIEAFASGTSTIERYAEADFV